MKLKYLRVYRQLLKLNYYSPRRRASQQQMWLVERLLGDGSPQAIRLLITTVGSNEDYSARRAALDALLKLSFDQPFINRVCRVWVRTKKSLLAELLVQKSVASPEPLEPKLFAAFNLLTNVAAECWKLVVKLLVQVIIDAPSDIYQLHEKHIQYEVVRQAEAILNRLDAPEAIAVLYQTAIETGYKSVLRIAKTKPYTFAEAYNQALFLFLTRQWEKYNELDFDRRLLFALYPTLADSVRDRIVEIAREEGRTEFIEIVIGNKRDLTQLNSVDLNLTVEILTAKKNWAKLWHLVRIVPPYWSIDILKKLDAENWIPENQEDKTLFTKLISLVKEKRLINTKFLHPKEEKATEGADRLSNLTLFDPFIGFVVPEKTQRVDTLMLRPLDKNSVEDLIWIQKSQNDNQLDKHEKNLLLFVETLLVGKWRHEIDIGEITVLPAETDIEIEG